MNGKTVNHFFQTVANGVSTPATVLSVGGLTLDLSCATGEPTVRATAAVSGSLMRGMKVDDAATINSFNGCLLEGTAISG